MKAKLVVEGKEFDIEILDPELQKLVAPPKKTGYERVAYGEIYYWEDCLDAREEPETLDTVDDNAYDGANYYSDRAVAENNARADKLMRQLRRFAVEHRKYNLDWSNMACCKYFIYYDYTEQKLKTACKIRDRQLFNIYFDSDVVANAAIEAFHDELIWYFAEYKDSL